MSESTLYARVSTDERAKKYSITAQLDLLRSYAKANSYGVQVLVAEDAGRLSPSLYRPSGRRSIL